jgi:hypothetical protein
MKADLLNDIDEYLLETGLSEYRFGILAARNGRLVERLRAGRTPGGKPVRIWPETEQKIRDYMSRERRLRSAA